MEWKWLWRYGTERDVLWRRVIEAKYGDGWGGWCTKPVSGTYGVIVWKSIRSGWLAFFNFLWYDVGDGTDVKFWEDVWCGVCSLKEVFPKLYGISRAREASVSEVMRFSHGRIHWDVWFRRSVQDLGGGSFGFVLGMLYSKNVRGFGADKVCWKPAMSKGFEVRGFITLYPLILTFRFLGKWCGNRKFLLE